MQRMCGYCATFQTDIQLFLVMVGEDGGNGKTLLQNLMTYHLSRNLVAEISPAVVFSGQNANVPAELAKLENKSLVMIAEPERTLKLKVGMVKKLTGIRLIKFLRSYPSD